MIRTQIQLEEDQYLQLRRIGAAEDKGLAEQVREAVGLYLARRRAKIPSLDGLSVGFRPLAAEPASDLKPHDRWLADIIPDSKRK